MQSKRITIDHNVRTKRRWLRLNTLYHHLIHQKSTKGGKRKTITERHSVDTTNERPNESFRQRDTYSVTHSFIKKENDKKKGKNKFNTGNLAKLWQLKHIQAHLAPGIRQFEIYLMRKFIRELQKTRYEPNVTLFQFHTSYFT